MPRQRGVLVRLGARRQGPTGLHQDGAQATPGQPSAAAPPVPAGPRGAGADGPVPGRWAPDERRGLARPHHAHAGRCPGWAPIAGTDGGTTGDRFLLLLNAHHEPVKFSIPPGPDSWDAVLTTGGPNTPRITPKGTITLDARSLLLLRNAPARPRPPWRKRGAAAD